ncbi:penicillin-binding protein 1A [Pseudorhodoferax sp. Leaf274]|uniref:penicillin-binding protein 1A n=1 Tax=Pseudorhodoferax sp. Leaf274 TaxID=1736318 RepID=UPI0007039B13|nr:PBP1A family penicillin-binding protein [Pseudorhodoferax sp. Leaf274]KQP48554.1 penicillin-binding protein [Pseudorhodoferax sp. Leaf274]
MVSSPRQPVPPPDPTASQRGGGRRRTLAWAAGAVLAVALLASAGLGVAAYRTYAQLPDVSVLADYQPKLPLRVYTRDGVLLGEFGEERRSLTPIAQIPQAMKDAVLAIEDQRFYTHDGVDYLGMLRAAFANLGHSRSQGASTITMQVARNMFLSSEKTYARKLREVLLTFKLERALSKDQILEIYMNQIFLGHRAYGFAAASEVYFGRPLKDITIAQAAMLAGLPKAPSANNPISNPRRARVRQQYIIDRMLENGFITAAQAQAAKAEPLAVRSAGDTVAVHGEYVAESVRQQMLAQYGDATYTRGLNVYTTLDAADQAAAYGALRRGIMAYERRQAYRGPETVIALPTAGEAQDEAIEEALDAYPDNGELVSAVVLEADSRRVKAVRGDGERLEITGEGLVPAQSGLAANAAAAVKIRPGAVIRVMRTDKGSWEITQLPEVEGAFVAMDPRDGAVRALVGGFDFGKNQFNHVTQAWRQPGSTFKPFVYSAALEKGLMPATIVDDGPLYFDASVTGSKAWEPKNDNGAFDGPMRLDTALAKSKNVVAIRVLQTVGVPAAQQWVARFGFDAERQPPSLTMALGAGSVTPLQMASAYSVFANGGYRVPPRLIDKVTDQRGQVLQQEPPPVLDEAARAVPARNAFLMTQLLGEVATRGTAARTRATLQRPDLYGKTGTTNDAVDAWFAGYQPTLTAIAWIGYDQPQNLGAHASGGALAMPVWIDFMRHALKGVPVAQAAAPEGVVRNEGDWSYTEYAAPAGAGTAGAEAVPTGQPVSGAAGEAAQERTEERRSILDLFKR